MDAGISVGEAAAAAIIGRDEEAGLATDVDLAPPTPAPGVWEPPEGRSAVAPWLATFRPFTLETPDQFRPGPPPALASAAYAADYDETLRMGAADSDERSRRQTRIAWFYTAPGAEQVNAALGDIVSARGLSTIEVARVYALVDAAAADAMVACFDAKYHYWSWRPEAAIANAEFATATTRRRLATAGCRSSRHLPIRNIRPPTPASSLQSETRSPPFSGPSRST